MHGKSQFQQASELCRSSILHSHSLISESCNNEIVEGQTLLLDRRVLGFWLSSAEVTPSVDVSHHFRRALVHSFLQTQRAKQMSDSLAG